MPNIVYTKPLTIKLGEATATAYHFDAGHTGGDTIVYFPDIKAILDATLVNGAPRRRLPVRPACWAGRSRSKRR